MLRRVVGDAHDEASLRHQREVRVGVGATGRCTNCATKAGAFRLIPEVLNQVAGLLMTA